MSQGLALLPTCCKCSVSRSSKPAAFAGFNRLTPVASSSRLKCLVSSVGGWLLLGTIVLLCSPGGLLCSTLLPLDNSLDSDLVSCNHGGDCLPQDDGWLPVDALFAVHGEVGVFHHVSPDLTSFIRYFIQ